MGKLVEFVWEEADQWHKLSLEGSRRNTNRSGPVVASGNSTVRTAITGLLLTKLRDLSARANYTDRVTAACRRS
jgi:hypothetical protein